MQQLIRFGFVILCACLCLSQIQCYFITFMLLILNVLFAVKNIQNGMEGDRVHWFMVS